MVTYLCILFIPNCMKNPSKEKTQKTRLQLLHQYYCYTGFYVFIWNSLKKALPIITGLVLAIVLTNHFFNISEGLVYLTETLHPLGVLAFFFASETFLGLIPPEIFIAWSDKMSLPWLFLSLLAMLSYAGGLISYAFGKGITLLPKVHDYMARKLEKQLKQSRKWGVFLIVVGALLPLPFSISCLTAGLIHVSFRRVMLFGSLRILRFFLYGLVIFHVV